MQTPPPHNEVEVHVRPDTIEANLIEENTLPAPPKSRQACCTLPAAALCVFIIGTAALGFRQGRRYEHNAAGISSDAGFAAIMLNTSADVCQPWEYLCGGYSTTHYPDTNVLHTFQQQINAELTTEMLRHPDAEYSTFFHACMDNTNPGEATVSHSDLWRRGLPSNNVQFFQRIPLSDTSQYPAILVQSLESLQAYEYAFELNSSTTGNTTACSGDAVLKIAEKVLNRNNVDTVIANQPIDVLCTFLLQQDGPTIDVVPGASASSCFAAAASLWPAALSHVYETYVHAKYSSTHIFDRVTQLATQIQTSMQATLTANHYNNLASKLASIKVHLTYVGKSETYGPRRKNLPFATWCAALQSEQFTMSAQEYADAMPAFWLNAYYRGSHNDVHITGGMMHYVAATAGYTPGLLLGKIGFVVAHEFAHALDGVGIWYNQDGKYEIGTILQSKANANKYAGDTECLLREFDTAGRTTNEDVADFIAMSVTRALALQSQDRTMVKFCAPECTDFSSLQLFYTGFAQTWCSGRLSAANSNDVHSAGKDRVVHALSTARAATAFGCAADQEMHNPCSILGFSSHAMP